jgi:tocopherol O-methyltransferase
MPLDTPDAKPSVPPVEDIARHYDSLDYYYRDIWGEHIHHGFWLNGDESPAEAAKQLSLRALERLEIQPGDRLLDVGCGYGGTVRLAAQAFGANVIGFTVSAAQKKFAELRGVSRGTVEIRLQDWAETELPEKSADAVLSLESIEHMPDRIEFLRQARRVLRPGGRLVVCTWLAAERMAAWSERHLQQPIATDGRQAPLVTAGELTVYSRAAASLTSWSRT